MELDEYPLHIQPLRLDEEIRKFTDCYGSEYAALGLDLEFELSGAQIDADPELLRGILTNVADNSLKYKQKERGKLRIAVHCKGDAVLLSLTDDGPGAKEEDLPKLFDPFYRSDPARHGPSKGSGLGLAIVARSVQRMGGRVRAKNASGGGLAILISLPGKAIAE
jgi:signal transduction histidine kinase